MTALCWPLYSDWSGVLWALAGFSLTQVQVWLRVLVSLHWLASVALRLGVLKTSLGLETSRTLDTGTEVWKYWSWSWSWRSLCP